MKYVRVAMGKGRLEAFSDGVIAIIVTIMVLEMKAPHGERLADLLALWPIFLSYVLSFFFVAIYWLNHHFLLHGARTVSNATLWANMVLLFFLSLVPFATAWMGENHFATMPVMAYAVLQLFCSLSFYVLAWAIARQHADDAAYMAVYRAAQPRNIVANVLYVLAVPATFVHVALPLAIQLGIAMAYVLPNLLFGARLGAPPSET